MDLLSRRSIEQRITIAAAEGLVAAGCKISVIDGEKVFLFDSTDPIAIDAALYASGEPGFQVRRIVNGVLQQGWVDFVGARGLEATANENLKLHSALRMANAIAVQLGAQSEDGCPSCGCPVPDDLVHDQRGQFLCPEDECGARLYLDESGRPQSSTD